MTETRYVCQFCKKEFKTENGFNKHMCLKKKRFVNFDYNAFTIFLVFCQYSHTKISKDLEKQKLSFINSHFYTNFEKLSNWLLSINSPAPRSYIKWLVLNNIHIDEWLTERAYRLFLYDFLRQEPLEEAIQRSESFLNSIERTLETIEPMVLYSALYAGFINYKYIKQMNYNYVDKIELLLSREELSQIKYFLES